MTLLGTGMAAADAPPPPYEGGMNFPDIKDPNYPEDYSWTVQLSEDQELKTVDDRHAAVVYSSGGPVAFAIEAPQAHDAFGDSVPTTLEVSDGGRITLTVHHRSGNPAEGGAPFVYPVSAGPGYDVGFSTVQIVGPPAKPLPELPALSAPICRVPSSRPVR